MKRVFALLAALSLCAGLALPAFAATTGAGGDDGSSTVVPSVSVNDAVGAQIISATATDIYGGELGALHKGDVFNVVLTLADKATDCKAPVPTSTPTPTPSPTPTPEPGVATQRQETPTASPNTETDSTTIPKIEDVRDQYTLYNLLSHCGEEGYKAAEDYIAARVSSASFSHTGVAEVGPHYSTSNGSDWLRYGEDGKTPYYFYQLIFRNVTYLGDGNTFAFTVSYPESTMAQSTLSFTVGQCITAESGGDDDEGSSDRTPHLMVRSSSYGNGLINAGTPFTLSVLIYATKGNESLDDVTVTLDLRSKGVSLAGGTLAQYIGTMKANSTREVYFTILPSVGFTDGVADIAVNLQGFGADTGSEANGSVSISVPIEQPDRFEITGMELTDTIYIGDSGSVSVSFVNKGRNPISNLEATISGMNLGADITQQYLGNLDAGTENSVDFDLAPTEEGPVTGTVTLSYEAADGTLKTVVQEFSATAEMMMFEDPGMMGGDMMPTEPEPQGAGLPLWGWLLIGAAVIGGIVAAVVLLRRRSKKKKAMASLEADDEDF